MLPTILSTIAGKLAAVGVVGAVSVGGLGAAGALPGPAQERVASLAARAGIELPVPQEADVPDGTLPDEAKAREDLPEPAREGMERAEALRAQAAERAAAARAHAAAVQEWTACVREAAAAHDADGAFDPEAVCGPRPVLTMPVAPPGADGSEASDVERTLPTPGSLPGLVPDTAAVPEHVPPVSVPDGAQVPDEMPVPPVARGRS